MIDNEKGLQKNIENALAKNWSVGERDISVQVSGTTVKLTGSVKSWYERNEAERIAYNAPGIKSLDNELIVMNEPDYSN